MHPTPAKIGESSLSLGPLNKWLDYDHHNSYAAKTHMVNQLDVDHHFSCSQNLHGLGSLIHGSTSYYIS